MFSWRMNINRCSHENWTSTTDHKAWASHEKWASASKDKWTVIDVPMRTEPHQMYTSKPGWPKGRSPEDKTSRDTPKRDEPHQCSTEEWTSTYVPNCLKPSKGSPKEWTRADAHRKLNLPNEPKRNDPQERTTIITKRMAQQSSSGRWTSNDVREEWNSNSVIWSSSFING